MKEISDNFAKSLRRKQADLQLNETNTSHEIGITNRTWQKIKRGDYAVRDTVYIKLVEWLAKDY